MAQVVMAYVPPDEDPDVDGPVDFEPDAWELADLARWDGTTRSFCFCMQGRRFAFARTGPRDPCDRVSLSVHAPSGACTVGFYLV